MKFESLKIKNIEHTIRFTPTHTEFSSKNKKSHIIGIQLSGTADHYFSDRKFTVKENDLYFFNKDEDYDVKIIEVGCAFSVHFTTYEDIVTQSFCVHIRDNTEVVKLLERIKKLYSSDMSRLSVLSDFYRLCYIIDMQYKKTYTKNDDRLIKAKEYIKMNFKNKYCLEEAVEISKLSRRRFNDVFKTQFSITPNNYLTATRINFAKKLLLVEYIPIEEVAAKSGFNDIYYFSKKFKSEVGETPSEYRKTILKL